MGDLRFESFYEQVAESEDRAAEIAGLSDEAVIAALAAASLRSDAYLANVLASEAFNRVRRTRTIVETAAEGMFALDTSGRVVSLNPAAERLLGWPRSALLGERMETFTHPCFPDGSAGAEGGCTFLRPLRTGESVQAHEDRFVRADGAPIPVAYTASPILREGTVEGVVVVFRDVTPRKRAEAERANFVEHLKAARAAAEEAEARARFLAEAGIALAACLDLDRTLAVLTDLVVPRLSDGCTVHLLDRTGRLREAAAAHVDMKLQPAAVRLAAAYAPSATRAGPGERAAPTLLEVVGPQHLEVAAAGSDEALSALQALDPQSLLVLPLIARGRTLGTLTLCATQLGRGFKESDLPWMLDLANRAALAMDNARVYREAQEELADRQRMEEALRRSETQHRALFTSLLDPVVVTDEQRRIQRFNPAFEKAFGYRLEDVFGQSTSVLYADPTEHAETGRRLSRTHGGEGFMRRIGLRRKDGTSFPAEVSISPLHTHDGRAVGFIGTIRDLTEHVEAEEALRHSEEQYRTLVEYSPDPIAVHRRGTLVYLNPAAAHLLGVEDPSEVLGRSALDFVHPESRPLVVERMNALLTGHEPAPAAEERLLRADGTSIWAEVAAIPTVYEGAPAVQLVLRDLTAEKAAQAEVLRLNEELEQRVRHRTRELAAANAELEAFSYTVSHDLRAPLRGIDYFSQILEEDHSEALGKIGRDVLQRVRNEAQRASTLVKDLLQLSQVGRAEISWEPVDLSRLARSVAEGLQRLDPDRPVVWEIDEGLATTGDPDLLRQVLENLISNAWKYTGKQPSPRIEFTATTQDGECVFSVRDNGAGFDPDKADRLFAPFQRLHGPQEFEGTGVGLATVQRILQRQGGRVWAKGALGKGATFSFTVGNPTR
ncbi:MAG TPA: PAS domain S-box protein [Candidatus Thermoplasmatota archaeon]|nr:PAS domain S-box protein [Candidatus Thermoplasmatota archaeon]